MTKVNKREFINILSKKTKLSTDKCENINNILERHFLLGKKNKDKIINDIEKELEISRTLSEEMYKTSSTILKEEIKNKIKHPFKR